MQRPASLPAGLAVEGAQLVLSLAGGTELTVDLPPAGIEHGDADGNLRGSREGAWAVIDAVPEAPKDGLPKARQDGKWVTISAGGGGGDDGGGSGAAASRLSVQAWDTDAEYQPGDLVRHRGAVWMARVETLASYPAPIATSGIWQLFSFPDVDCDLPLSHRHLHLLPEQTYHVETVATLIDQLIATVSAHERRITALE